MDLWIPTPEDAPEIPASFLSQLRNIDKGLVIYWNRFRGRFIIDRCIHAQEHIGDCTPSCERANVMIVETDEHTYMPPNDRVLDEIRSMDAWKKYGAPVTSTDKDGNLVVEGGLLRQRREREIAKEEWDAKVSASIHEDFGHAAAQNKAQLLQAYDLIKTHDIARPHKHG